MTGLALALALPGCGSQGPSAAEATGAAITSPPTAKGPTVVQPTDPSGGCASGLSEFLGGLEHLRRSLVIGVSYEQYVSELGTIRHSYEQVPVAQLDLTCVTGAADSAERSFDVYLAAANTWGDCISKAGCETAALEPKLQREWRAAAKRLAAAKQALAPG